MADKLDRSLDEILGEKVFLPVFRSQISTPITDYLLREPPPALDVAAALVEGANGTLTLAMEFERFVAELVFLDALNNDRPPQLPIHFIHFSEDAAGSWAAQAPRFPG